jgi:hypothetical protein
MPATAKRSPRSGFDRSSSFNIGVTETNTPSTANQCRVQVRRLTSSFRYPKGTNRVRYILARYTNRTKLAHPCTQSVTRIPRRPHIRHHRNCIPVATNILLSCRVPRSGHPPTDRNSACRPRDNAPLSGRSQMRSTRPPQSREALGCSCQNDLATSAFAVPRRAAIRTILCIHTRQNLACVYVRSKQPGAVERAIREPAIGRKNYLFTGSKAAAVRLAAGTRWFSRAACSACRRANT